MGNTLETDIISILQDCVAQIKTNMQTMAVNASGRTSDSVVLRNVDEGGYQIVAGNDAKHSIPAGRDNTMQQYDTALFPTVEVGRKPGKVPTGFYYILKEWSREKGIQFSSERERATFAYFLGKKIAKEGTQRYSNNIDVYTTPVNDAVERIRQACSEFVSKQMQAAIGGMDITTNVH